MAAILVADIAPGAKPRRHDSVGGTGNTVDLMHQIERSLQAGGGGHGETVTVEKHRTIDESVAADY